jgi:hypothetical protein
VAAEDLRTCRILLYIYNVVITGNASGLAESTMLAIMGHMSRAMLERYSHIRLEAKRQAVEALRTTVSTTQGSRAFSTVSTTVEAPVTVQ